MARTTTSAKSRVSWVSSVVGEEPHIFLLLLMVLPHVVAEDSQQCKYSSILVASRQPNQTLSANAGLTANGVRQHIAENVGWADPQRQWWSCVDGRSPSPGLTTPAGDSGEFVLGLAVYEQRLLELTSSEYALTRATVKQLFQLFMQEIPYSRPFYMHTDQHAVDRLRDALQDPNFDPANTPPVQNQNQLFQMLIQPQFIGCGHMRLLIQHPDLYNVRANITQWFIQVFFDFMWNHEQGGKLNHHTSTDYLTLTGEHQERAVVIVTADKSKLLPGDKCYDLAPMIPGLDNINSFFTDHQAFINAGIRGEIASFFALRLAEMPISYSDHTPVDEYTVLLSRMTALGSSQLDLTVGYLAGNDPQYVATIVLAKELDVASFIASMLAIAAAFASLVAMAIFGLRRHRLEEEEQRLRLSQV